MINGVLISLPDEASSRSSNYFHGELALAEGFQALGIPVFSNHDYFWLEHQSRFAIPRATDGFTPDLTIHSSRDLAYVDGWWKRMRSQGLHVVVDTDDGTEVWLADKHANVPDLVLRCHYRKDFGYAKSVRPWALGLTQRIMDTINPDGYTTEAAVNVNFRHDHNIRRLVCRKLTPLLTDRYAVWDQIEELQTENKSKDALADQTVGRHYSSYFDRLNRAQLTYCFAGNFVTHGSLSRKLVPRTLLRLKKELAAWEQSRLKCETYDAWTDFAIERPQFFSVHQPDTWRLWEALVSNTVPLHLDLKALGWGLPEMPVNGVHYLGVRDWNFEAFAQEILSMSGEQFGRIISAGREFALQHYSPVACARRLMFWLGIRS